MARYCAIIGVLLAGREAFIGARRSSGKEAAQHSASRPFRQCRCAGQMHSETDELCWRPISGAAPGPGDPRGDRMDFGFSIPHRGPLANPADQKRLAQTGERLGYAALTVSDHIVIPRDIGSKYPYSETGDFPGSRSGEALEMIALLAFLCGVTEMARLITSVMVLPHRNPVLAAKQLATADLLSGGRVTVGCGVGWMREEFEAVGLPPFDERGRVADEYLRVFKAVWTEDPASFAGDYAKFSNVS
ncbi:MAG: LLM class flavin-dependent oxidoreductase, partial [Alphaproteobacteria bacterium]|nr:LLM class flavin-dependent oxidoreductase [Alphaproteobacteria bacterium]